MYAWFIDKESVDNVTGLFHFKYFKNTSLKQSIRLSLDIMGNLKGKFTQITKCKFQLIPTGIKPHW